MLKSIDRKISRQISTKDRKMLIAKHDSMFSDYILFGNDWFYGHNSDGNQGYLAEIVTDAKDV
ncbi:17766_t:CDS:2 [Rhizophagus irregularis]|nr:17766_t:CDS:2 [Rhizophagus irregularis]